MKNLNRYKIFEPKWTSSTESLKMDGILEFFLFILFVVIIVCLFGTMVTVANGPEITPEEYILVAEMIEKNPAIKPEVDRLMEDNKISPFEYANLSRAEAKLRVKNAR